MDYTSSSYQLPFSHINDRLSILCTKCEDYIDIRDIQKHRELHRALKIFRSNFDTKPKALKQLLKKRRIIINDAMSKADSGRPLPAKTMQKIDWAFEMLKNQITQEGETMSYQNLQEERNMTFEVSGHSEKLEASGLAVGVCQCKNEHWRTENEDRYCYKEGKVGGTQYGFLGLFDGYNGVTAAKRCSELFHDFLIEEVASGDNDRTVDLYDVTEEERLDREHFIKQAIKRSFSKMDRYLLHGKSETSKHRWSGASATICYIENETLYIGNVGDVRALFVNGQGNAESLVEDHILRNKKERDRIRKANGSISMGTKSALVNGLVSSTRGLGNHGDPNLKSSVISKPKVDAVRISSEDQFVIAFTAGVWEVFSDEEVMFLLEDIMPDTSGIENLRQHFQNLASGPKDEENQFKGRIFGKDFPTIDEETLETIPEQRTTVEKLTVVMGETAEEAPAEDVTVKAQKDPIEAANDRVWLKRDATIYKESKACFLARALVERLAHAALLAGSRENITATVILFTGCPVNLYLLPSVKRKSVVQKEWIKNN